MDEKARAVMEHDRAVGEMVGREMMACVSVLVRELAHIEKYQDELMEVFTRYPKFGENGLRVPGGKWCECGDADEDTEIDEDYGTCENCYDPDPIEALEHWIVAPWFGGKLKDHGEMVTEFLGLTIWGRTTSGQAIKMDGVINSIYDEVHGKE